MSRSSPLLSFASWAFLRDGVLWVIAVTISNPFFYLSFQDTSFIRLALVIVGDSSITFFRLLLQEIFWYCLDKFRPQNHLHLKKIQFCPMIILGHNGSMMKIRIIIFCINHQNLAKVNIIYLPEKLMQSYPAFFLRII